MLTDTVSGRASGVVAASAAATAPATSAEAPTRPGLACHVLARNVKVNGRAKNVCTAVVASSAVKPPTGTPAIVTLSAINGGGASAVVVASVVVVTSWACAVAAPRPARRAKSTIARRMNMSA